MNAVAGGISLETAGSTVQASVVELSSGTGVTNAGNVLSGETLVIAPSAPGATTKLTNTGRLQAGGTLQATTSSIDNRAGGTVLADRLNLSTGALQNAGQIQATRNSNIAASSLHNLSGGNILTSTATGGSGDAITVSGDVFNDGTIASKTSLNLTATGALTNSSTATLDSDGALGVTATSVANEGMINADGALTITSQELTNDNRIQGGSALTIEQRNSGGSPRLTNLSHGVILSGGTLDVGTGLLENSGIIQAAQRSAIYAATLNNLTVNSRILTATQPGGSASTIVLTGDLSNAGALHGASDLSIQARGISNLTDAGLSSLNVLSLNSTADIVNAGSIYAGRQFTVNSSAAFRNVGVAQGPNLAGATVMAGVTGSGIGAMLFNVDSWINTGAVLAERDVTITTRVFQNNPIGNMPTINRTVTMVAEGAPRADCAIGSVTNTNCFIFGTVGSPYLHPVLQELGFAEVNCNEVTGDDCAPNWVWQATYNVHEPALGPEPVASRLLAGGAFTLSYTGSARNLASLISADTITVNRLGGATALQNTDLYTSDWVMTQALQRTHRR